MCPGLFPDAGQQGFHGLGHDPCIIGIGLFRVQLTQRRIRVFFKIVGIA
jgi:hypothetical protein